MSQLDKRRRFEVLLLPHLDAAYNLARWLSGSSVDADDIVQETYLRAWRFFDDFKDEQPRAWLLAIVRNTWFTEWRRRHKAWDEIPYDDTQHGEERWPGWSDTEGGEQLPLLVRDDEIHLVHRALATLPVEFREVLVLRELEDMDYRSIATIIDVPMGTVMSRLSRGRRLLGEAIRTAQTPTSAAPNAGGV